MPSLYPTENNVDSWLQTRMKAKCGGYFIPSENLWRPDPTCLATNIGSTKEAVQEPVKPWLTVALAYYATIKSIRTLNVLAGILRRCAIAKINILDERYVISISRLISRREFSTLRVFINEWRENFLLPISPCEKLVKALYEISIKNNDRMCPVESMNPITGPFTVFEMQCIFNWSNDAFSHGRLSFEKFIYIRLLIVTGARKRQLQQLIFEDITDDNGLLLLRLPKAKVKGYEYRNSFQTFKLPPDFYEVIKSYRQYTFECLKQEYPDVDWKIALPFVPLFRVKGKGVKNCTIINSPDLNLLEQGPQEKFHKTDGSMSALFMRLENDETFPVSERTGQKIHLSAHRFRYTLGTDMSRMGYGSHAIASALTHKNINCVGRYIKISPEMGKRIDEKIKKELTTVLNVFQGKIVKNRSAAINGDNANKDIRSQTGIIASCGSSSGCHLDAPIACYTCSKFQPWIEANHEEVLERLKFRQQRAINIGGEHSIEAISFEKPILAVVQVIDKIKTAKEKAND